MTAGLALYDTMGHVSSDVITCNVGMAASMGSFILGAGQRGKRIALPHSKTMIHQPMGGARGQAEDIRIQAEQIVKIKASLVDEYADTMENFALDSQYDLEVLTMSDRPGFKPFVRHNRDALRVLVSLRD